MREFFNKPAGKAVAIALVVIGLGLAVWTIYSNFQPSAVDRAIISEQIFIDATTGKVFDYTLKRGDTIPVMAPTGKKTGYLAELCFWTKDGKPKSTPTPVLLNSAIGKSGPTFCPDCGRLVVGRNPPAGPGMTPPPTKDEYEKSGNHSNSNGE